MSKAYQILLLFLIFSIKGNAAVIEEKIYMISDSLEAVDGMKMPYISFNATDTFTKDSPNLILNAGDSLALWVVNLDTVEHYFEVKDFSGTMNIIPAGDSSFVGIRFNSSGNHIYYDPLNYPTNSYLGLAGMIVVKNHTHDSFYWNIKEHHKVWNETLVNGGAVSWDQYYPQYFTINGNSNPNINLDTNARIVGKVGDTLILYLSNTGQSIHSIHLHGYHATILFSSQNVNHVGRLKDTFPIYPMETLTLRIVPDKTGEYPVHDHNLVAVTANNIYPNGMFTTMIISQ